MDDIKIRLALDGADQVQAGAAKAAAGLSQLGEASGRAEISAGQLKAAYAQLPAQLQDFFIQVQGGQSVLTAFVQQGSQVAGSFGGVGNALRAVAAAISPTMAVLGGAAVTVGVLAKAYSDGAAEAQAYTRALVLSGNAAGVTAGQLQAMAAAQSSLVGTQGDAARSLAALASTGQVASESLGQASEAATRLARVGVPLKDTVKAFADLGKDPLKAVVGLNEAENFLTQSVYAQIKALTEQGRLADAANVAQQAYATAAVLRSEKLVQSLGSLERAWISVKDVAAGAWDKMLNVGRPVTLESQLSTVQAQIAAAQAKIAAARDGSLTADKPFLNADRIAAAQERELKALQNTAAALAKKLDIERANAAAEGDAAQAIKDRIKWQEEGEKYLSKQAQLEREIAKIRQMGAAAGVQQAEIEARIVAARAKYADTSGDNELAGLRAKLKETNAYIDALNRQGPAVREANEGEKAALRIQEELRGSLSASTRAEKERALALATTLGQRQRLAADLKADYENSARSTAELGQQADAIRNKAAQQEAANAVYGKSQAVIEALVLAEAKKQARDLEATNNVDPKYLANLYAKIGAQERYVAALKATDFKQLNQGAQEWLRNATESARLQATEPAMLSMAASERERLSANRATDLKLAQQLNLVELSGLDLAQKAVVVATLRAAAEKERERNATAASQSALREVSDFLDPGRAESFGAALSKAFQGAGDSLGRMTDALRDFSKQQAAIAKQQINADQISDPLTKQVAQMQLAEKSQQNQIALYANITGAAKGFFREGTKGYKALEAAETAFRVVQLASNLAQGISAAAVGVANQAKGDPYTAFPRMATMAAAMAALGFAVGFTGGGSGGGGDGAPVNNGTGTVLGDASAQSESLANSIDHLGKTAKLQLTTQSGMLAALRNIESSISGLSSLVLRSGTSAADAAAKFNVREGYSFGGAGGFVGAMFSPAIVLRSLGLPQIGANLFGSKTKITGNGLFSGAQDLASIVSSGLNLQDYVDVNKKSKFFGITYNSSNSTNYAAADAQLRQQFGQVFKDLYTGILAASSPLGVALDEVRGRLDSFVVNIGKIDLQNLTGEQINEKLKAVLGAAADNIASAALPGLQEFQKVGEGYFETVVRVASGVETAKDELSRLGVAAVDLASLTRKQGDVAAELVRQSITAYETAGGQLSSVGQLISTLDSGASDMANAYRALVGVRDVMQAVGLSGNSLTASLLQGAGGLDNLSSALSTYLSGGFFTDQERAAAAMSSLQAQFARIGIQTVPATYAEFRKLVEGIDGSTAAGQALRGQVLSLAGDFEAAQRAAEKAGTAVAGAASRLPDVLKSQASDTAGLMVELLKAQGDAAGAAALKRSQDLAALTAGMTAADAAAAAAGYDNVAALRAQVEALNAAKTAAEQAAQAEAQRVAAVASQRDSIQARIDELLGDTAAIRARELAALDESNRALQQRLYALQDEAAAAQAAAAAAQELANKQAAIASQRDGIQAQIDQLLGDTAAIRARELAGLDESNRALQQHLYALQDQAAAAQAAAAAAQELAAKEAAVANQRDGIQARIDELLGNTSAIRARELDALDPANRALQQRYYALLDEASAAQAAAAAAQELANKQAAIASQRDGIQARIDELKGDTAAIRARELAGLDESNRALQQHYYELLDAKAAAEAAAQAQAAANQAAQQAAQAAEQVRNAWRDVSNSLLDEVARLRGQTLGQGAQGLAAAQTRFAITTAQARAGDQEAAKLLPSLSKDLLDLVTANASSRADVERAQARVAASLEGTAGVLGGMFGFSVQRGPAVSPLDVQGVLRDVAATAPIVNAAAAPQQAAAAAQNSMTELVDEVRTLRAETQALRELAQRSAAADERTRDVLVNVTEGGRAMQVEQAS